MGYDASSGSAKELNNHAVYSTPNIVHISGLLMLAAWRLPVEIETFMPCPLVILNAAAL